MFTKITLKGEEGLRIGEKSGSPKDRKIEDDSEIRLSSTECWISGRWLPDFPTFGLPDYKKNHPSRKPGWSFFM